MDLLHFIGRLHVLVLHLPIGILLLAVLLEILSRSGRFAHLRGAVGFVWAAGAVSAIGTVALGYLHAGEGGFEGHSLGAHRMAGTAMALLACVIWVARGRAANVYRKVWWVGSLGILSLLVVTGHFGGNMTHGDTYLAEYAPAPLRGLLGMGAAEPTRAPPASVESADIYLDVVSVALRQRCGSCHNESKRKGEFSVASYEAVMAGGKGGKVVAAGKPQDSDLIRRINLDPGHADFMPQEGKEPLTADQTAAIAWWVSVGAPRSGSVATLKPTPVVAAVLANVLGFAGSAPSTAGESSPAAPPGLAPPDDQAVSALEGLGFVVRPIEKGSPLVQVDYTAQRKLTDADLAALARICPQVQALNLRNAGLLDQHLEVIGRCENLVHLRLELNPVSDAGLVPLQGLGNLEYLNLYGTRISNKGLLSIAKFPKLRELYVWQTSVTASGIAELKRGRSELDITAGFDPRTFPEGPRVLPVVN